jgi:hypothetical protein
MRLNLTLITLATVTFFLGSCKNNEKIPATNIVFLHHSTGGVIWKGNSHPKITKIAAKVSGRLAFYFSKKAQLPSLFEKLNKKSNKNYIIKDLEFPKASPYGWTNDPYDYYNIWVKNAGEQPFMEEPTLEILTKEYNVIIFKHCYPVTNIQPDLDTADINSKIKTVSNYKLQYSALRDKLHEFPKTKFILFTGAAQIKAGATEDEAKRAKEFFTWVTDEWDLPEDNIYLWDLRSLQTEGGLYFREEYAVSADDSHPNTEFAGKAANLLFSRIIDVIEHNGTVTLLTGELKQYN